MKKSEIINEAIKLRNKAMLVIISTTSLTMETVCELKLKDYDIEKEVLWIRAGRDKKRKSIPINMLTLNVIFDYWAYGRRSLMKEEQDYLFVGKSGKPLDAEKIINRLLTLGDTWRKL